MAELRRILVLLVLCLCGGAYAGESVSVCFNFSCAAEQIVVFSDTQLVLAEELLAMGDSAEHERLLLSLVIGQLYRWAGQQSPVSADRAGNFDDGGVNGGMDCIDHSTTTTRFLRMLDQRGALHYHRVLEPVQRGFVLQHLSAQIEEIGPELMQAETEHIHRYAVDSWYVDNGKPAPVMPIELWKEGRDPI